VNVGVLINGRLEGWPQEQTMIPGKIVIPIKPQLETLKIDGGLSIKYHSFGYEFTFSMTYHKIQGQTVDKIILDLNSSPSKFFDLPSVYIGMSSVRNSSKLSILPLRSIEHLYALHYDETFVKWWNLYCNNNNNNNKNKNNNTMYIDQSETSTAMITRPHIK